MTGAALRRLHFCCWGGGNSCTPPFNNSRDVVASQRITPSEPKVAGSAQTFDDFFIERGEFSDLLPQHFLDVFFAANRQCRRSKPIRRPPLPHGPSCCTHPMMTGFLHQLTRPPLISS